MSLLVLILAIVFGLGAFTAPSDQLSAALAAQGASPEPLTVNGEPVTTLGIEPVSGEVPYVATATDTWMLGETGDWQRSGPDPGHEVMVVDSRDPLVLWAGTGLECYRGGGGAGPLARSTDGGATWVEAGEEGIVPLASWLNTGIVVGYDCSGLLLSTDSGETWAVPEGMPLGFEVTAFTVASTPDSAAGLSLLAGITSEGGTTELWRVSISEFEPPVVEGPLQTYYAIGAVEVLDDGAILLGTPQGVMRSDDGGETWSTFRGGLESTTLDQDPLVEGFPTDVEPGSFGLQSMLAADDEVYVGGVDGIYRWSEAEFSWVLLADLDAEADVLAVQPETGSLLAETLEGNVLQITVD